ncbi:MAG TPA: hypothetical protein VEY70_18435 [Metabacillus sp.]|nr:hypothetical protein [Metabacillus sp.]
MKTMLKNIAKLYFYLEKKMNHYLNTVIQKEVEKAKRNFEKQYKMQPTDDEIKEMRKNIVMSKAVFYFLILVILLFCLYSLF